MRITLTGAAMTVAAAALPLTAAAAATGTPQRSGDTPPGLAKKLTNPTYGFLVALVATEGSNSRLQDLPASP